MTNKSGHQLTTRVMIGVKSVDPGLGSDQTFIALLRNEAGSEIRKDLCRLGEQIL